MVKISSYVSLFFLFTAIFDCRSESRQLRVPQPDLPGLLIPDSAIPLQQSDFDSGSYRIKTPGYYYLAEDIFFNPNPELEAQRTDKPQIGAWFAALSIECDNVVIDLNKHTFAADEAFLDSQKLKVFALIEFGNSPFPLQKFPFFSYTGQTEPIFASNVTVKNGTIGASPHHGLHGNSNSNIQIYDITVRDWEVAGIAFNGLKSGVITNVTITGLEHPMDFTGLVSVMLAVKVVLEDLRDNHGDQNAQAYIDALQPLIDDPTQNGAIHPTRLNYGNVYGIFLNRAFDIGPVAQVVNDQHSNAIIIENVLIANVTSQLLETVAIGNNAGQTMMAELFGTFRWEDAYQNGVFAPNVLLKAQVYVQQQRAPQKMPAGFAENILSDNPSEELFLSQVRPIFGLDFPGHANKGIFGIRVDAGYGVTIKNCSIMGLNNRGLPGKSLDDIPSSSAKASDFAKATSDKTAAWAIAVGDGSTDRAGENYEGVPQKYTGSTYTIPRYAGNDVHGISLAVCRNCAIVDCDVSECSSDNGNVYGILMRNMADANRVDGAVVTNLKASRDDEMSAINPSSIVYGMLVDSNCHANSVRNISVHQLSAPRFVYGFYAYNTTDTYLSDAHVSHLTVSADPSTFLKEVAAYATVGSYATRIENSSARVISVFNEENFAQNSGSIAAGFIIGDAQSDKDIYTVLSNNSTECIAGGAGIAAGLLLQNAEQCTITDNNFAYSVTNGKTKRGYAILNRVGANLSGLIIRNNAYGNNFKQQYEFAGARYPVLSINTQANNATTRDTAWYNVAYQ